MFYPLLMMMSMISGQVKLAFFIRRPEEENIAVL
jgi:hypothetical protein